MIATSRLPSFRWLLPLGLIAAALISLGLVIVFVRAEYHSEIASRTTHLQAHAKAYDHLLSISTKQVQVLKMTMEDQLQRGVVQESVIRRALVDQGSFFHLDNIPKPYTAEQVANITGTGSMQWRDQAFEEEINATIGLFPMFRAAISTVPDLAWTYYLSEQKFTGLAPWVSSDRMHFEDFHLDPEFYQSCLRDPSRPGKPRWVEPYIDYAGKGMMVTCSAPVHKDNLFRGTVGLDLTLDTLNRYVHTIEDGLWHGGLISGGGALIANTQVVSAQLTEVKPAIDIFDPQSVSAVQRILSSSEDSQVTSTADFLVFFASLEEAPWRLIYEVRKSELLWVVTQRSLPLIIVIAIVTIGLFAFGFWLIQRQILRPAERMVDTLSDEIASQRALIADLIENAPLAIAARDLQGRELFANRLFTTLALPVFDDAASTVKTLSNTGGSSTTECELAQDYEGVRRVFLLQRFPLRNPDGQAVALCLVALDVTLRKEAEMVLQRSRDELEQVVTQRTKDLEHAHQKVTELAHQAGMAEVASVFLHFVGNLLTSVLSRQYALQKRMAKSQLGSLEKLAQMVLSAPDLKTFILEDPKGLKAISMLGPLAKELRSEAQANCADIEELGLVFERIAQLLAQQQTYVNGATLSAHCDLAQVVESATADLAQECAVAGVELIKELPPLSAQVQRYRLVQVLKRLFANALEAMQESAQKRLRVRLTREGNQALVLVSDTGCGLDTPTQEQLFQFGFSTKGRERGFGLHFCVVEMQAMGGKVTAQSDGPGQGAQFCLHIPL